MGKKKMVMRRIAALLIASLVVTSSAFTSLAVSEGQSVYVDLSAKSDTLNLIAGGDDGILEVVVGESTKPASASALASSTNAAEAAIRWSVIEGADYVSIPENDGSLSCIVTPKKAGVAKVKAEITKTTTARPLDDNSVIFMVNVTEPAAPTVEITPKELELKVNETGTLEANATAGAQVSWKSSNENVATVDNNGKVTAIAEGEATITATAVLNKKTAEARCTVTVIADTPVNPPTEAKYELTLNKTTLNLVEGDSEELTATVTKDGVQVNADVLWSLSNESKDIVIVDKGKVTALKAGEATVIATATVDDKKIKAECAVTVKAEDKFTVSLGRVREALYLLVGEGFKLDAVIEKNGVAVQNAAIEWSVNGDKDVITLSDSKVTGAKLGKVTLTAKATVDGKAVTLENPDWEVNVIPKAIISKENLTLIVGSEAVITLDGPDADAVIWDLPNRLDDGTEDVVEITKAEDGKSITVKAMTPGKAIYRIWGELVDAQGERHYTKNEFAVEVIAVEPTVEEPKLDDNSQKVVDELVAGIEDEAQKEEIIKSVEAQTNDIHEAVKAAVESANIETNDTAKEVFAAIEEVPVNSEIKLLSVSSAVKVETGSDGKPILGDDGKPVVVIHELVYNIGIVTDEGEVLPHDALENNNRNISINVPLPAVGIKNTWRYATIKHYADEADILAGKDPLQTLYSNIFGSAGNKYITLVTKKFSPFVLTFSETNPNPPSNNGGSSSGGGGGSRRHVVGGGGSSTNSYSMTGNWVAGANGWSFVKSDGSNAANTWGYINGQYYYFDAAGNMATGWQLVNGKWYYLNATTVGVEGAMLTGVIYDPAYNAYFYADANGAMVTGWYQVGANWYYFSPVNDGVHVTGQLLAGTYVDGYYLGADGAWVPGN